MMWLAFWAGGLTAVVLHVWIEFDSGEVPDVARASPWRFGALLLALVACWPAGLALVAAYKRRVRREQEAEQEEWERIEATREPVEPPIIGSWCPATRQQCDRPCIGAVCLRYEKPPQLWVCPQCGRHEPVPKPSSPLVSKVIWFCAGCLTRLEAPAPRPDVIDCDYDD